MAGNNGHRRANARVAVHVRKQKQERSEKETAHRVVGAMADALLCPVVHYKRWLGMRDEKAPYLFHAKNMTAKLHADTKSHRETAGGRGG